MTRLRPKSVSSGNTATQFEVMLQSPHPSQTISFIKTRFGGSGYWLRFRRRRYGPVRFQKPGGLRENVLPFRARGICGDATREASLAQVKLFVEIVQERRLDMQLIGVGGASNGDHVIGYLDAGANAVHIASAAMVDPLVGIEIRRWLASAPGRKVRLESGS